MEPHKASKIGPPPTEREVLEWLADHRARIGPTSPRDVPERLRVPGILERLVVLGRIECRKLVPQREEQDRKLPVGRLPTLQELLAAGPRFRIVRSTWDRCHPSGASLASGRGDVQLFLSLEARRELLGEKPASDPPPAINADDARILGELGGRSRTLVTATALGKTLSLHRNTVAPRLRQMEGLGLVEFPRGRNSGCRITTAGRDALARLHSANVHK